MKPQLTIEAFAEWCEKQPADATYKFVSCAHCACGQYADQLGLTEPWFVMAGIEGFWHKANFFASHEPHTFGALATRLRQASTA